MVWLGITATVCTVYGAIAVTELTLRAKTGQDFLSMGLPAVADSVTLDVQVGRGDPHLREVQVEFKSADHQSIQTMLSWIDLDTPISRNEERQSPSPERRTHPRSESSTFQTNRTQQSLKPTPNDSSPTAISTEDGPQHVSLSV